MAVTLAEAVAAHQNQDMVKAERLYRDFLTLYPDHADACALLGVVIGATGNFKQAIDWVDKAVRLDPSAGILRYHQGTVLMAAQKLPDAVKAFAAAVALQPQTPQIHYNFANALRASGDWKSAIAQYEETLRCDPNFLGAHNNLALSYVHEKRYGEALAHAKTAVTLNPSYGEGWLTLCNVAEKLKDYDLAVSAGKRVTELLPENHYAWFGYGVALNRMNRDQDAVLAYTKALSLNPSRADIWDNLAQSYQSLNWLDEAEATFRRAVEVADQVIADEENRVVDESEYGNRHWHLALIELLRGKYLQGFARYRARVNEIKELKRLSVPFPLWKGEDLHGKTILVCDEQGYGDTLMLARFLPLLKARGAYVIASVHPVLHPLLLSLSGADSVIAHGGTFPPCDYFCSFFDLPHLLGTTLETIPNQVPYLPVLAPDERTRLVSVGGKFKCGVVWGGSPLHLNDGKRSIPLAIFADLFTLSQFEFYSFNRDLKPGDAELLPDLSVKNLVPLLSDFAEAARLIEQMDLVITCDTATAHLAGALGKPTWILLPFAPDWRWLTERIESPWYPTMSIFRQPTPGDWQSVIASVKQALLDATKDTPPSA